MNPRTRRQRRQNRKHNRSGLRLEPVIAKGSYSFCNPTGHDHNYGLTHVTRMRWVTVSTRKVVAAQLLGALAERLRRSWAEAGYR